MRDYELSLAIGSALAAVLAVNVYGHGTLIVPDGDDQDRPEIVLPAAFVECKSEPLAGSAVVARGIVEIAIESQGDDDSAAIHASRVAVVKDCMADIPGLLAAFQARASVELLGKPAPLPTNPEIEQRSDRTVLTYRLGYRDL